MFAVLFVVIGLTSILKKLTRCGGKENVQSLPSFEASRYLTHPHVN